MDIVQVILFNRSMPYANISQVIDIYLFVAWILLLLNENGTRFKVG